jgi:NOL1/NOP2/fmu family ribosome biogenesis protein
MAEFLDNNKSFRIVPIDADALRVSKGFPEAAGSARVWPHLQRGEGHFVCVLEKSGDREDTPRISKATPQGLGLFREFCAKSLNVSIEGAFEIHGDVLYKVPEGMPDLSGIRLARSGLRLGDFKAKRFEPSQALAMALKKGDAKISISFDPNGDQAARYLKGESFEVEADDGWALACVGDYPLGWAKIQNGRLKNKYLKGWING